MILIKCYHRSLKFRKYENSSSKAITHLTVYESEYVLSLRLYRGRSYTELLCSEYKKMNWVGTG
jgi:hypothetical protein